MWFLLNSQFSVNEVINASFWSPLFGLRSSHAEQLFPDVLGAVNLRHPLYAWNKDEANSYNSRNSGALMVRLLDLNYYKEVKDW